MGTSVCDRLVRLFSLSRLCAMFFGATDYRQQTPIRVSQSIRRTLYSGLHTHIQFCKFYNSTFIKKLLFVLKFQSNTLKTHLKNNHFPHKYSKQGDPITMKDEWRKHCLQDWNGPCRESFLVKEKEN